MYRYCHLQKKHVTEVQLMISKYLAPAYFKRLNITKDNLTPEIIEFEPVLGDDYVENMQRSYSKYSLVCENNDGKVVSAMLNSYMTKKEFFYYVFTSNEEYLEQPITYKSIKENAEFQVELFKNFDLVLRRLQVNNVLYASSNITLPTYRGKRLQESMFKQVENLVEKGDMIVGDTMLEEGTAEQTMTSRLNYEIIKEIKNSGFICHLLVKKIV